MGHDLFERVRIHLAVADLDPRFRDKIDNAIAGALDRLHPVVQKENLTLPLELALDRIANDPLVVTAHDRFNRETIERRRLNRRHVFYSDQ